MRIASGLATAFALLIGSTLSGWAQGPGTTGSTPAASGSTAGTLLGVGILVVLVIAIVVGARYVSARRQRIEAAIIVQSPLSDVVVRAARPPCGGHPGGVRLSWSGSVSGLTGPAPRRGSIPPAAICRRRQCLLWRTRCWPSARCHRDRSGIVP